MISSVETKTTLLKKVVRQGICYERQAQVSLVWALDHPMFEALLLLLRR